MAKKAGIRDIRMRSWLLRHGYICHSRKYAGAAVSNHDHAWASVFACYWNPVSGSKAVRLATKLTAPMTNMLRTKTT